MLKRKYMIIVALTVVSILLGSLLYSNLAFGANGSSGNWGAIRFEEPTEVEVPAYPDKVVVAQFDWHPQNSSNNALLYMRTYWQYCKKIVDSVRIYLGIKLYDDGGNVWEEEDEGMWEGYECYQEWKWTASKRRDAFPSPYTIDHWDYDYGFPLNQVRYRFVVEAYASNHTAYVRNVNVIILVADGMLPNEYYWVPEFPAATMLAIMLPIFMILSLITVVFVKLKKKKQ